MPTVVLIRPGCTDFDKDERIQGTLDLPLNAEGEEQVKNLVAQIENSGIETIITSSSEPALSTAEQLGENLGIPVKEKEGLKNLNQGLWQGLEYEEVRRKYPKLLKQWTESPETVCPPEGELASEAVKRVQKTLQKYLKKKQNFAIVASEPLATIISCLLRKENKDKISFEHNGKFCQNEMFEILESPPKKSDSKQVSSDDQTEKKDSPQGQGNHTEKWRFEEAK
ncbi:Phosphoserine phosphatase 1 [Gimesia maris]|uniref:histidine phosphatase family protein n=1 Tax=Gimesia maris TaxID=122 RepID=UPI001187F805|nr:histidine phosphatase family protein [Gimesia maris]QDU14685.1 Phosphoserine phosphatase 1 [Gimesia maris]